MENWKVYKHTSPSGKVYIGITSKNVNNRWSNGNGYPNNKYFTNAIQKYGWENFKHEILFENLSKEEACQKEIELIAKYKSNNQEFGYNQSSGGEHSYSGCKHIDEQCYKIGLSHKNRIWINNDIYSKMIYTNELDFYIQKGFKLGRIPHSNEAKNNMSKSAKKRRYSDEVKLAMSLSRKGKPHPHKGAYHSEKARLNHSKASAFTCWINNGIISKKIKKYDIQKYLDNGFVLGRLYTRIHNENEGKNNTKVINQYDKNGNFIKQWNSLTEAANYYNITISAITNCLKGKTKTANKFIWKYV